jgi:hypothetical protein
MSTSGSISTLATARQVIDLAAEKVGIKGQGSALSASDADIAMRHLNWMLKGWQADGCHLFREFEDTATFAIDTATVTLSPRVLDVMEARVVRGTTHRTLGRWERGQYVSIPNKTASGVPTAYVLTKGINSITMTVWPVPTVSTDVIYTASRVIEDITSLDDNLDLPQEWTECVFYNLAKRLGQNNGFAATPDGVVLAQHADALYRHLSSMDRPASYFMSA